MNSVEQIVVHEVLICCAVSPDNIYGDPLCERCVAVPYCGHNVFFGDKDGNWWSTFFGNDGRSPFRRRPAVLRVGLESDGRIRPVVPQKGLRGVSENTMPGEFAT